MPTTVREMLGLIADHPANRGRRVQAFARMALWQGYKRAVGKPFDLRVYDGMRFRAYPDSTQVGRLVYFGGLPDYQAMTFMKRYLRPGDGFIDGGANEGIFTLLAAQLVSATGEVHAFEAHPVYAARLRENVERNRLCCVSVHEMAVGQSPGAVPFVLRGTGSRIRTEHDEGKTVSAQVVRLDEVLSDRSWAMGKLDIEGAEHCALRGAEKLLCRAEPPVWFLELVDPFLARFGSTVAEVRGWLGDHGYDLMHYEPALNRFVPAPAAHGTDVFAVSRQRADEIDARLRGAARA
ncbi:FkbM family methyltransferase [Streptomyces cavernae]|uniref:FkbM family methyltransferase n=1 Tax=Streptomyces cavernae TaxID=2259034 RepID=UPI0013917919|nr:FkbM family methyltransferase [Streptomyces cavernae]